MTDPSHARVLIVGDEILNGRTRDANGGWLAARLDALGYRVRRIIIAPDEDAVLEAEVQSALADAPTLIVTGGLGPTHDDRTTAVLARLFNRDLVLDDAGWTRLQEKYTKRFAGENPPQEMVDAARKMVTIPAGSRALPNPTGVATGYVIDTEAGSRVIVLPGVPAELQGMFQETVEGDVLPARVPDAVAEVDVRLPEARFAHLLARVSRDHPDVTLGSYPHRGTLLVTVRVRGLPARVDAAVQGFRALLKDAGLDEGVLRDARRTLG
jgi:molybdenum cofactor synthesis domain-containing protein